MLIKDRLLGGVYGLAVGDALGVPVEFVSRAVLDRDPVKDMRAGGTYKQPKGTWSDDTSLVLATMDAMAAGELSYGRIMDNFVKWLKLAKYTATGVVFDVGGTTATAIQNYLCGKAFCGLTGERDNGNGSLMRMLPMIYYIYLKYGMNITPLSLEKIYRLSALTHAHTVSKTCCVYYVYIGVNILAHNGTGDLHEIIKEAVEIVDHYYFVEREELPSIYQVTGLDCLTDCMDWDRDRIDSSGYVIFTLVFSIWSLWNSTSYEETVLKAVNMGGDTDTTAAVAGSLAGIWYGVEAIPRDWMDSIQNRKLINGICERFFEMYK